MKALTNFPFAHKPKTIMIRKSDLMEEYGLTRDAAYELLRKHGVTLGGTLFIERDKADRILEGPDSNT